MDNNILLKYKDYIYKIASAFSKTKEDLEDYKSVATIGFLEALKSFDKTKNCSITTYACNNARYSILDYSRDVKIIKYPREYKYSKAINVIDITSVSLKDKSSPLEFLEKTTLIEKVKDIRKSLNEMDRDLLDHMLDGKKFLIGLAKKHNKSIFSIKRYKAKLTEYLRKELKEFK